MRREPHVDADRHVGGGVVRLQYLRTAGNRAISGEARQLEYVQSVAAGCPLLALVEPPAESGDLGAEFGLFVSKTEYLSFDDSSEVFQRGQPSGDANMTTRIMVTMYIFTC